MSPKMRSQPLGYHVFVSIDSDFNQVGYTVDKYTLGSSNQKIKFSLRFLSLSKFLICPDKERAFMKRKQFELKREISETF